MQLLYTLVPKDRGLLPGRGTADPWSTGGEQGGVPEGSLASMPPRQTPQAKMRATAVATDGALGRMRISDEAGSASLSAKRPQGQPKPGKQLGKQPGRQAMRQTGSHCSKSARFSSRPW